MHSIDLAESAPCTPMHPHAHFVLPLYAFPASFYTLLICLHAPVTYVTHWWLGLHMLAMHCHCSSGHDWVMKMHAHVPELPESAPRTPIFTYLLNPSSSSSSTTLNFHFNVLSLTLCFVGASLGRPQEGEEVTVPFSGIFMKWLFKTRDMSMFILPYPYSSCIAVRCLSWLRGAALRTV